MNSARRAFRAPHRRMSLPMQALAAALLTLLSPLIAWHALAHLDAALLTQRIEAQQLSLARLQLAVPSVSEPSVQPLPHRSGRRVGDVYAVRARSRIEIDGYADDWRELPAVGLRVTDERGELWLRAAQSDQRLYLLIDLDDGARVYHRPVTLRPDAGEGEWPDRQTRLSNGDALELFLATSRERVHALLSPIAPGALRVVLASPGGSKQASIGTVLDDWQAAWMERPGGYRVEVSLPLSDSADDSADDAWAGIRHLGVAAIDVPERAGVKRVRATLTPRAMRALHARGELAAHGRVPGLFTEDGSLRRLLLDRVPDGARVRIYDPFGRLLADVDRLNPRAARPSDDHGDAATAPGASDTSVGGPIMAVGDAILMRVFSFLLARELPLPERAYADRQAGATVAALIDPDEPGFQRLLTAHRYVTPELDRVLGTVHAFDTTEGAGWIWYETNEEHSSAYAGNTLAPARGLMILVGLLLVLLLVGWASVLWIGVRRLTSVTRHEVDGVPSR